MYIYINSVRIGRGLFYYSTLSKTSIVLFTRTIKDDATFDVDEYKAL